jgi:hypothetical protein
MPITPANPQDHDAIIVVVLIVAGFCACYWKTALRLIAIGLIALFIYGLIMSLHGLR